MTDYRDNEEFLLLTDRLVGKEDDQWAKDIYQ